MGVYIKGMEMPTSEEKCKFFQPAPFRSPYCVINGVCGGIEDCPLVPVPPHGRLIDADDLLAMVKRAMEDDDMYKDDYRDVRDWLAVAPTIIPAEEGK